MKPLTPNKNGLSMFFSILINTPHHFTQGWWWCVVGGKGGGGVWVACASALLLFTLFKCTAGKSNQIKLNQILARSTTLQTQSIHVKLK